MATTTAVNEFDASIIDDIDQESVERNESDFPTIQWHRGDPKMKKVGGMDWQGGWFVSEAQAPVDLTECGWEKVTWTHDQDNESDGYYIRELTVSVIQQRQRWEVYDNGRRSMFAWTDYDSAKEAGRASGRSHTLVLIKGLEDCGPFILTLRGMAGMYFYNKRNSPKSALGNFDAVVVRAGNDAIKKSGRKGLMPRRAFWLTAGASRNEDGTPLFIEVGSGTDKSSMVMPVALDLPEKPADVDLGTFFVGRELLARTNELWNDTVEWSKAWETITPGTVEGESGEAAKPAADAVETVDEGYLDNLGM